uniref:Protein kinase domain-containing protein n=1 Tax=Salix viminalis TaxID=40686 RepID=A0A6N2K7C3_SALVM
MALINAKLALLATHFLGVASYGFSSLQASNAGDDDLGGRLQSVPSKGLWTKLDSSFKSGLQEEKEQDDDEDTNDGISDGKAREEDQRSPTSRFRRFQMSIPRVSFAELKKATTSFDRDKVIGVGTTGTVYKAAHPHLLFTERLLVYQYMPNGNLHDWLHPVKGDQPEILEWHLRVNIAVGIARGIFMADSEMDGWDLIKEDVHQLGVLLLELITGEDPSSNSGFFQSLERKFVQNDCPSTVSAALYCSVDKSLVDQGFDGEVLYFLKVACNCVHPLPNRRPTMVEVHKMLMAIHVTTFWAKTNISMSLAAPQTSTVTG